MTDHRVTVAVACARGPFASSRRCPPDCDRAGPQWVGGSRPIGTDLSAIRVSGSSGRSRSGHVDASVQRCRGDQRVPAHRHQPDGRVIVRRGRSPQGGRDGSTRGHGGVPDLGPDVGWACGRRDEARGVEGDDRCRAGRLGRAGRRARMVFDRQRGGGGRTARPVGGPSRRPGRFRGTDGRRRPGRAPVGLAGRGRFPDRSGNRSAALRPSGRVPDGRQGSRWTLDRSHARNDRADFLHGFAGRRPLGHRIWSGCGFRRGTRWRGGPVGHVQPPLAYAIAGLTPSGRFDFLTES